MQVNYTFRGEAKCLDLGDRDLHEILIALERRIGEEHVQALRPELLSLLTDRLLNELATDSLTVQLGEIAAE